MRRSTRLRTAAELVTIAGVLAFGLSCEVERRSLADFLLTAASFLLVMGGLSIAEASGRASVSSPATPAPADRR